MQGLPAARSDRRYNISVPIFGSWSYDTRTHAITQRYTCTHTNRRYVIERFDLAATVPDVRAGRKGSRVHSCPARHVARLPISGEIYPPFETVVRCLGYFSREVYLCGAVGYLLALSVTGAPIRFRL